MQKTAIQAGRYGGILSGAILGGLAGYSSAKPGDRRNAAIMGALAGGGAGYGARRLFNRALPSRIAKHWKNYAKTGDPKAMKTLKRINPFTRYNADVTPSMVSGIAGSLAGFGATQLSGLRESEEERNRRMSRMWNRPFISINGRDIPYRDAMRYSMAARRVAMPAMDVVQPLVARRQNG